MRLHRNASIALVVLVVLTGVAPALSLAAETAAIAPFFGHYEGRTIIDGDGETTMRDLEVTIETVAGGSDHFRINWSTIIRRSDGESKRKSYSIVFTPTPRPGIFASAMRTDMFGNAVPLDPLKGDPFVWCRIVDATLTVYALTITDDGGYDLQVYDRTLRAGGLDLRFTRLDEGEPPVVVSAVLERTTR
jgi:hypothetical protein